MRIFIDARYLRSDFSGIGTYSLHLLEAISKQDDENEYVVMTHSSFKETLELGPNFTVAEDPARPVSLRTVTTFKSAAAAFNPDIYHALYPLVPLTWQGKLAVTVHDLQPLVDPAFTGQRGPLRKALYDTFYRVTYPAALRKANVLVADSYATRRTIEMVLPDCAGKVLVVHGGVGADCFEEPTDEQIERAREKYSIPRRFLFYLGSTRPNKNLPMMLDAFERFVQRHPEHDDLCWVLVVKPDRFFDPFFAQVRERGLLRRVLIHQQVSEQEKRVFYKLATMLYLVTKHEGFGLPVLEAQAQGLPVLASTHGALPEVAGSAAILCDADSRDSIVDGLERFFADSTLRERMAEAGLENVRRFTWAKAAREIVTMYNHLLA